MTPTPHEHAELIKQWADAPEWWDVYWSRKDCDVKAWGLTNNPDWDESLFYELRKSAKHPDNIKPVKKLIDWSKMPRGTMTNRGTLLSYSERRFATILSTCNSYVGETEIRNLRLKEQTQFTYWGGGECPVPEGVVVECILRKGIKLNNCSRNLYWKHDSVVEQDRHIIAYRITGLADGWTDDPNESGEN